MSVEGPTFPTTGKTPQTEHCAQTPGHVRFISAPEFPLAPFARKSSEVEKGKTALQNQEAPLSS